MELAYGDYHHPSGGESDKKQRLKNLVSRTQRILEETNCLKYSAARTIEHLQKNPNAMAAVALLLAEISNLVTKMGPSALAAFRTASPGVFGLLASPQFLIAAGVGVGITVVMFGGYKVVKQIKAAQEEDRMRKSMASSVGEDEMLELNTLGGIERWRRGVADVRAESCGSSSVHELITPAAHRRLVDDEADGRFRFGSKPDDYDDDDDDGEIYAPSRGSRRSDSASQRGPPPTTSTHRHSRHSKSYHPDDYSHAPSRSYSVKSSSRSGRDASHSRGKPPPRDKERMSTLRYLLG